MSLKPCPFCDDGGHPVYHPEKGVKCHRCGCWGPDHDESSPYGWNTRAEPIMPDQIDIYRLIKAAGVRKHGEIAKVIADHLAEYGKPETLLQKRVARYAKALGGKPLETET